MRDEEVGAPVQGTPTTPSAVTRTLRCSTLWVINHTTGPHVAAEVREQGEGRTRVMMPAGHPGVWARWQAQRSDAEEREGSSTFPQPGEQQRLAPTRRWRDATTVIPRDHADDQVRVDRTGLREPGRLVRPSSEA